MTAGIGGYEVGSTTTCTVLFAMSHEFVLGHILKFNLDEETSGWKE